MRSRKPAAPLRRLFLLSPARVDGARAGYLLNPAATFTAAERLRSGELTLAAAFAFTSGLYFRGKIVYAERFARRAEGEMVRVITSDGGLLDPDLRITPDRLRAFGEVPIDPSEPRYREPLERSARALAGRLADDGTAILLGSIATPKYRDVLLACFGPRLVFPREFVGRGDMSRGGLLLRAARGGVELEYAAVDGAVYRGKRSPRLAPLPRAEPPPAPARVARRRSRGE